MAIIEIGKIQHRSGNLVDLPQLSEAELGWATDAKLLFIGKTTPNENVEVLTSYSNIAFSQIVGAIGNLNISNVTVADGQLLVYDGNNWVNRGGNAGGLITLGSVSNVKMDGGGTGYVLETDGAGNLSWAPKSTSLSFIQNITKANPAVVTTVEDNFFADGMQVTFTNMQGMTDLNGNTYYANVLTSNTFSLYTDSALTSGLNSSAFNAYAYTSVTATTVTTNVITVGSSAAFTVNQPVKFLGNMANSGISNVSTYYVYSKPSGTQLKIATSADGNVSNIVTLQTSTLTANVYQTGGRAIAIVTGATGGSGAAGGSNTTIQYNSTGIFGGSPDFTFDFGVTPKVLTLNGNANLGNVGASFGVFTSNVTAANVYANTGTIGASLLTGTLTTNAQPNITSVGTLTNLSVTGNVTAANLIGSHANGNSNVNIPAANGNVNISAVGNANILVVTGTGANVNGTFSSTGNANVGNLGAAAGVFTANVSAGNITTAAGTFTANITAANIYANTGTVGASLLVGTLTTAAQPNITSVGTLTSLAVTGNVTAANIYANTGTIGASLFTGTLTTAAQPNVTSLGNGTQITVAGNLSPNANVTYNLGNATNRWNDIYLAGNTIYLGNATISSNTSGVVITNPTGGSFTISGNSTANVAKLSSIEANATKNQTNFVVAFGGVPDGVTNNNTQLAAAEASSANVIYLPEGNYFTTLDVRTLAKVYIGPGKIRYPYGYQAAQTMNSYTVDVSPGDATPEFGLTQSTKFTDFDYKFIPAGKRVTFDRYGPNSGASGTTYFWGPSTPQFTVFENKGGYSGVTGRLSAPAIVGSTSATITGLASDWNSYVGRQIGFSNVQELDLNITDTSSSNNTVRVVGNFNALGIVRGTKFKPSSSIGGLVANTTYWVLTVVSSAPTESFFTVSATSIPNNPLLTPVTLTTVTGQIISTTFNKITSEVEPAAELVTITGINTGTSSFTFTPALQNSYIINDIVLLGYRTMNAHQLKIIDHGGGGDSYAYCARVSIGSYIGGNALGSQTNVFDIATGGIIGGSMSLISDGRYATGWECVYDDNGYDGAVIGRIDSYVRKNNTASRTNSIWLHNYAKMDNGGQTPNKKGLKPLDGVYVASVAARTGLDFTKSSFSVAAVAIPLNQKVGFDATVPTTSGSTNGWGFVAGSINNMYISGSSDIDGKYLQLVNDTGSLTIRPTIIQSSKPIDVGSNHFYGPQYKISDPVSLTEKGKIIAGTDGTSDYIDWWAGATYRLRQRSTGTMSYNGTFTASTGINSNTTINAATDIAAGGAVRATNGFYINANVYIYWDGTNLRATKNGGASSVIIV